MLIPFSLTLIFTITGLLLMLLMAPRCMATSESAGDRRPPITQRWLRSQVLRLPTDGFVD